MSRPLDAIVVRHHLPAALFLGFMLVFFRVYDPYVPQGAPLSPGGSFDRAFEPAQGPAPATRDSEWRTYGSARWRAGAGRGGSGGYVIDAADGGGSVELVLSRPLDAPYLRLTARMRGERIEAGAYFWNTGHASLVFSDVTGAKRWDNPHLACLAGGTFAWRTCSGVFPVPPFAVSGYANVGNTARSGTLYVDDVEVVPVRRSGMLFVVRAFFASLWIVFALRAGLRLFAAFGRRAVPALLFGGAIAIGAVVPQPVIETLVGTVRGFTRAPAPASVAAPEPAPAPPSAPPAASTTKPAPVPQEKTAPRAEAEPARATPAARYVAPLPLRELDAVNSTKKVAHFAFFAVVAFASFRLLRTQLGSRGVLLGLLGILLFAAGTECLQLLTDTRTASAGDWLIDSAGTALGFVASRMGRSRSQAGGAPIPGVPAGRGDGSPKSAR